MTVSSGASPTGEPQPEPQPLAHALAAWGIVAAGPAAPQHTAPGTSELSKGHCLMRPASSRYRVASCLESAVSAAARPLIACRYIQSCARALELRCARFCRALSELLIYVARWHGGRGVALCGCLVVRVQSAAEHAVFDSRPLIPGSAALAHPRGNLSKRACW